MSMVTGRKESLWRLIVLLRLERGITDFGCGKMLAGGYCEAAQRHWGKKGRLERGSKMLGNTNHLAGQG
jgi:hypothetical protein